MDAVEMARAMLRRFRQRHRRKPKTLGADAGYEAGKSCTRSKRISA
jgi:hypothetical protein